MSKEKLIEKSKEVTNDAEVEMIFILKLVWLNRKVIIRNLFLFSIVGLSLSFLSRNIYTSSIVVKPIIVDTKAGLSGGLGGLAAMAGLDLSGVGSSAEIHPSLYPSIVESFRFKKALLETPIYSQELNKEIDYSTYFTEIYSPSILYYIKRYTIGLPGLILKQLNFGKESDLYDLDLQRESQQDRDLFRLLGSQFNLVVDEEVGTVELSCSMPNKIQSAQMVQSAQELLQREVIAHKLKKVEEDLAFIEERHIEKKVAFEQAQNNLAKYRDSHKNVNTAIAQTEIERLESEYQLAFSVYSELAKQVESQKIKVKENTPVFVVLKEPVIPFEKSNYSKFTVLVIWAVFGVVSSMIYIFGRQLLLEVKSKWD